MLTHNELQTWYTDGGRRLASATGAKIFKVKGQGRKVTWSACAVCSTCVIRVRRGHSIYRVGRTRRPHSLLVLCRWRAALRVYVLAEYFVKARNPYSGRLEVSLEEV